MGVVGDAVVAGAQAQVPVGFAAVHVGAGRALLTEGREVDRRAVGDGGALGGALAEGEAQVLGLPGRQGVADAAALRDGGADGVGAGEGAWGDGLVGGGAAEYVDVPAGLVAYP